MARLPRRGPSTTALLLAAPAPPADVKEDEDSSSSSDDSSSWSDDEQALERHRAANNDENESDKDEAANAPPPRAKCPVCLKWVSQKTYRRHVVAHTTVLTCPHTNCGKSYNRRDLLKRHLRRRHEGWACDFCSRTFPAHELLAEHMDRRHARLLEERRRADRLEDLLSQARQERDAALSEAEALRLQLAAVRRADGQARRRSSKWDAVVVEPKTTPPPDGRRSSRKWDAVVVVEPTPREAPPPPVRRRSSKWDSIVSVNGT